MEKKKLNLEEYKGKKYAVHCDTAEKAEIFCKVTALRYIPWWGIFRTDSYYHLDDGGLSCKQFCINYDYTILEFDDFDWTEDKERVMEKKKFKLEDYKDGKYAMHCDTAEKAEIFCKVTDLRLTTTNWNLFKEDSYYDLCNGTVRRKECCINYDYTILEFDDFDWTEEKAETDYRTNIIAIMDKQEAKGIKKYGEVLEDNTTLSRSQRIEHLQEELIDALQYCEHLKASFADKITGNDYQRMAMRTATNYADDTLQLIESVKVGDTELINEIVKERELRSKMLDGGLGLAGESGEVADIIKKWAYQGHKLDKEHLKEELGDVMWYIALIANGLEIPLEEVMRANADKLKERYPEGFDKNRSINRKEN